MKKIKVKTVGADNHTVYLYFKGYTLRPGVVKRTIPIAVLVKDYIGPQINLDFDGNGRAIGIEVLATE